MANTLLHAYGNRIGANYRRGRACPCCCSWAKERDRRKARRQARRQEERAWRADQGSV